MENMTLQDVETLVEELESDVQDIIPASYLDLDPTHDVSPHESDDELTTKGYVTGSEEEIEIEPTGYVPSTEDYCSCDRCWDMPSKQESYCCHESELLEGLREGYACVVVHPRFEQICLSRNSLEFNRYLFGQAISDVKERKAYYRRQLDNGQLKN